MPFCCCVENGLRYVTNPDFGLCRKPGSLQFARNLNDQFTSWLLLIFQLGSVVLSHLRRRRWLNWLQNMQNQNFCILVPNPSFDSVDQVFRRR
jgi:hypothetical protein